MRWDGARAPICMCGFSFISALGCSYLWLACSLLGLLLPALLVILWMEKEVQTLFRELSCPPGQFRDVLTNLGPPWEMQPVPAVPASSTCLGHVLSAYPNGHHGGIQAMDGQRIGEQGELGEALAGLYPMLRRHQNILDHSVLISHPTSVAISSPFPLSLFLHQEGRKGGHIPTSLQVSVGSIKCFETCRTVLQELEELPCI